MVFMLKEERLPVEQGWGVLYSLSRYRQNKGGAMTGDQNALVSLIEKVSISDEAAMSSLYDMTVNRVYGMAMKIVLRPELAEEVVGDVYMQVWRQATHYKTKKASPMGWVLMICRSRALDILRREKSATRNQYQEEEMIEAEDTSLEAPLSGLIETERSKQIIKALDLLNKKQRECISLAFYKDMSHKEISEYTGQPLGTVKSNIRRAQDILRNILGNEELCEGGFYGKA